MEPENLNSAIKTGSMDDVGTRLQFLTELYELPLNRFGRVQRGHLIKGLVEGGHAPVKEEAP